MMTTPLRVCHLCSGIMDTHYFATLAKGLAGRGVETIMAAFSQKKAPEYLAPLAHAQYRCLDADSRLRYPFAIVQLADLLKKERVSVLQSHLFDASIVGLLAARLARIPLFILTRHHSDQVHMIGTRAHVALDRFAARHADRVVVLSNAVRDFMVASDHIDAAKIQVIYQGFDFEKFSASDDEGRRVRAELNLGNDFVVGCIGRLVKLKGQNLLLAAIKELLPNIPNIRVLLVGGGSRDYLEEEARRLGVEDRVIFAGFRKDVAACVSAADVVVHPSLTEAFCQVLIETMAVGRPLITTSVGGALEVVTQGETGLVIPPSDVAAIRDAILALHRDPELRGRIALAGQQSVRERFTIDRMIDQQIECYDRWLNRSRPV